MSTRTDGRHFSGPSTQVSEAAGLSLPCHALTGRWVSLCLMALCTLFSLLELRSQHGAMAPRPRLQPAHHLPSRLTMHSGTHSRRHPGSPCKVRALPLTDAGTCSVHSCSHLHQGSRRWVITDYVNGQCPQRPQTTPSTPITATHRTTLPLPENGARLYLVQQTFLLSKLTSV